MNFIATLVITQAFVIALLIRAIAKLRFIIAGAAIESAALSAITGVFNKLSASWTEAFGIKLKL